MTLPLRTLLILVASLLLCAGAARAQLREADAAATVSEPEAAPRPDTLRVGTSWSSGEAETDEYHMRDTASKGGQVNHWETFGEVAAILNEFLPDSLGGLPPHPRNVRFTYSRTNLFSEVYSEWTRNPYRHDAMMIYLRVETLGSEANEYRPHMHPTLHRGLSVTLDNKKSPMKVSAVWSEDPYDTSSLYLLVTITDMDSPSQISFPLFRGGGWSDAPYSFRGMGVVERREEGEGLGGEIETTVNCRFAIQIEGKNMPMSRIRRVLDELDLARLEVVADHNTCG